MKIPFNQPPFVGPEIDYVKQAVQSGRICGDGQFNQKCHAWLENRTGVARALLTTSCTHALEMSALLCGIQPGDEVIMPSFTFVSTADAFAMRGAKCVFVDIRPDTMNIDEKLIEDAITEKTRAIVPVHYAGVGCEMDTINAIAKKHNLFVIEDAAHAIGSDYLDTKVGSCRYSDMTVFSFHPVKTITTGEGGAVTTNDPELYAKLCALRAHGVHKDGEMARTWEYEMRELGFNYRITDIQCALGVSQLKKLEAFKARRRAIVAYYNEHLGLPHLVERDFSNACFHLYPVLVANRREFYFKAKEAGLNLQVHYIPVHTQPYYRGTFGYKTGDYPKAEAYYEKCISLPLYPSLTDEDVAEITSRIKSISC